MTNFVKTTPGFACKAAVVLNAEWVQAKASTVKEAVALDGTVVAYSDCDGWFVASTYADIDVAGVIA